MSDSDTKHFFLLNFSHVVASSRQALCFATLQTSWLCALLLTKSSAFFLFFTQFFFSSQLLPLLCWCWSENFHHSGDDDSNTDTHIHTITTWRLIKVRLDINFYGRFSSMCVLTVFFFMLKSFMKDYWARIWQGRDSGTRWCVKMNIRFRKCALIELELWLNIFKGNFPSSWIRRPTSTYHKI